jgi:hypothetical protein
MICNLHSWVNGYEEADTPGAEARAFHVIATLEADMMLARVCARARQASWRTRSSRWTSAPSSHKLARASVKWVRPR